jgi:hypothetical protein
VETDWRPLFDTIFIIVITIVFARWWQRRQRAEQRRRERDRQADTPAETSTLEDPEGPAAQDNEGQHKLPRYYHVVVSGGAPSTGLSPFPALRALCGVARFW